jgi:hypothetical protein
MVCFSLEVELVSVRELSSALREVKKVACPE